MESKHFLVFSLWALPSLNRSHHEILNSLGIYSIAQLLQYGPIEAAVLLAKWAAGEIPHDLCLSNYLYGRTAGVVPQNVLALSVRRLRGLGDESAQLWESGFGVRTVRDLSSLSILTEARGLLRALEFAERPSAPDYLVPKPRDRSKVRHRYKSWTRTERVHLRSALLRWEPGLVGVLRTQSPRLVSMKAQPKPMLLDQGQNGLQRAIAGALSQPHGVRFYLGFLILTAQDWSAQDFTLGDISHTIGLAPGQSKRIATVQWNRYKRTQRTENTEAVESLQSEVLMEQSAEEQIHDLTLQKTRDAESEFATANEQQTKGLGASFGTGSGSGASAGVDLSKLVGIPLDIAGAGNTAFAGGLSGNKVTTKGSQQGYVRDDVTESTRLSGRITSDVSNYTKQSAVNVRSLRSTVVLEDAESDTESVMTTVLTNYNHSHALNIQCYQLLRRFAIFTQTDEVVPIIYLPIQPIAFNFGILSSLWDYLRPVVRLYDANRFLKWDAMVRYLLPINDSLSSLMDKRISFIRAHNPYSDKLSLRLRTGNSTAVSIELPEGTSEHAIDPSIAHQAVTLVSVTGANNDYFSGLLGTPNASGQALLLSITLTDKQGEPTVVPFTLDLTCRQIPFAFGSSRSIEGESTALAPTIESHLRSLYLSRQTEMRHLLEHLNNNALAYTRYIVSTCSPADLEDCLEQVYLRHGTARIALAQIADITNLLGITGTHLIYPLRRLVLTQESETMALGEISGVFEFGKTGVFKIERATVRLVRRSQDGTLVLEFGVVNFPYGEDPEAENHMTVSLNYSKDTGSQASTGTMAVSNTQPEGGVMEFDLSGTANTNKILEGSFAGDAQNQYTIFRIRSLSWKTKRVYAADGLSDDLQRTITDMWDRAEDLRTKDEGICDYIDVPSSGLFWEAVLGLSNASEYVDPRRFTAWHEWPIPFAAAEIGQVQMGQHQPAEVGNISPTVPEGTLQQVAPSWVQPFSALSQIIGSVVSAPGARGNADSLLGISKNLSDLAKAAGEQASGLTGSLAASAMGTAVELGKQVAGMTNNAMSSINAGGGGVQSVQAPSTQTQKAGALNLLDEIGANAGSAAPNGQPQGPSGSTDGTISRNAISNAQAAVVGAPLKASAASSALESMMSGAQWAAYATSQGWGFSVDPNDLVEPFRTSAIDFINALRTATPPATVEVQTTWRHITRAWLMHWAWTIAHGGAAPAEDPYGTGIIWDHGSPEATRAAAQEMIGPRGFNMAHNAAVNSNHMNRTAIDMTIGWPAGDLVIARRNGSQATITTAPRNGNNRELQAVGATYGVLKLVDDPPHWSIDRG